MTQYLIKEGAHYATPKTVSLHQGMVEMHGKAVFSTTCWYRTQIYGSHLNKLVGFTSDLFSRNSLRIAWRPSPIIEHIDLYIYLHINGKWVRSDRLVDDNAGCVKCGEEFDWSLHKVGDLAIADTSVGTVTRHYPVSNGWGYQQGVYYGGRPTAPWDMTISLSVSK